MTEKPNRFKRLEYFPLLSVFRKPQVKLKRFEHLEVDGHKIQIKIAEEVKKNYAVCPKCLRHNPKESLYCLYCTYVFQNAAQEEAGVKLEPWEMKCQGCGRIVARSQEYCLYCGFRLTPLKKQTRDELADLSTLRQEYLLKAGELITLNVDGKIYRSTDRNLPQDIKELMLRIKQEGYSQDLVDVWIKDRDKQKELFKEEALKDIQQRQFRLRLQLGLIFCGIALLIALFIFSRRLGLQFLMYIAIVVAVWLRARHGDWWWRRRDF